MAETITPRDRVIRTLKHGMPDRVPINAVYHWSVYSRLRRYYGLPEEQLDPDIWGRVWESPDLTRAAGMDCINIGPKALVSGPGFNFWNMDTHKDHFGVIWRKVSNPTADYFEMVDFPIKEPHLSLLDQIQWPDPENPAFREGLPERVESLYEGTELAIVLLITTHIWERAIYMCGYDNWWFYLMDNPDFCKSLLRRIATFQKQIYMDMIEKTGEYAAILRLGGEDFGTQDGLLISPSMFRQIVKPILMEVYLPLKERYVDLNPNGKLMLHSDGAVGELIPDFIQMGIDVLDPVQPGAKGMAGPGLKEEYGSEISFHGGVDTQRVLPFGGEEDVKDEVKKRIQDFGKNGGYILAPSHSLQPDVPTENMLSMVQAAREYGKYPLEVP